jgi:threonine dehydratase
MPITLAQVAEARRNIAGIAVRTPLVRLNTDGLGDGSEIYLKLESLQPIGAFKIRGAANIMARTPPEKLAQGVFTASAGNMAQGVAYCARRMGIPATVIAPDTAPETKTRAVERMGGRVLRVPREDWWRTFETRSFPGVEGTFIHAFDDPDVMAGNGTISLELLEDLPEIDAVVIPWGGGGLACGIAAGMRELRPACKVFAAEVATASPLKPSLEAGTAQTIDFQPTFVDGIGAKTVFPRMLELAQKLLDRSLVATLDEVAAALRIIATRNRVIAEGAGATAAATALSGQAGTGKVVCIVSGGNIDFNKLCEILTCQ